MANQAAETPVSYTGLLAYAAGLDSTEILWGPSFSAGTRVWLRINGHWRAYLVTDLVPPASTGISSPLDSLTPQNVNVDIQGVIGAAAGGTPGVLPTAPTGNQALAFVQDPVTGLLNVSVTSFTGTVATRTGFGNNPSLQNGGSAVAPGANTIIATVTAAASVPYNVWAYTNIALGAPVAGDEANMQLRQNAVVKMVLPYTSSFGGPFGPFRFNATIGQAFDIQVIAAGTVGVVYVAGLVCVPVA